MSKKNLKKAVLLTVLGLDAIALVRARRTRKSLTEVYREPFDSEWYSNRYNH